MKKTHIPSHSPDGIDFQNIKFDPENVRINNIIKLNPEWGHSEIKEYFLYKEGKNNIKTLKEEIKAANQLFEAIVVKKLEHTDDYLVLEGNQRLAAYYWLKEIDRDESLPNWPNIDTIVISDYTDIEIKQFLHFIHVKGKDPWKAYNKALQVITYLEMFSEEDIQKKFRLTKKNIEEMKETVEVMELNRLQENKYSIISWLVKCRDLNDLFIAESVDKKQFYKKFIKSIENEEEIAKQAGVNGTPTVQLFKSKKLFKEAS